MFIIYSKLEIYRKFTVIFWNVNVENTKLLLNIIFILAKVEKISFKMEETNPILKLNKCVVLKFTLLNSKKTEPLVIKLPNKLKPKRECFIAKSAKTSKSAKTTKSAKTAKLKKTSKIEGQSKATIPVLAKKQEIHEVVYAPNQIPGNYMDYIIPDSLEAYQYGFLFQDNEFDDELYAAQ